MLFQPSELVTIGGAAIGTPLVANPIQILKAMMAGVAGAAGSSKFGESRYLDTLKMMFELCNKVRKKGLMGIEDDIEKPAESEIFKKYPAFLKDHFASAFVCDTLRTAITGGVEPFDMDQMMELDMEVAHQRGGLQPAGADRCMVADALPGPGNRRRRLSGRGHHHGFSGRPAGGDRQESRRRAGRHLPRDSDVWRTGGACLLLTWRRRSMH